MLATSYDSFCVAVVYSKYLIYYEIHEFNKFKWFQMWFCKIPSDIKSCDLQLFISHLIIWKEAFDTNWLQCIHSRKRLCLNGRQVKSRLEKKRKKKETFNGSMIYFHSLTTLNVAESSCLWEINPKDINKAWLGMWSKWNRENWVWNTCPYFNTISSS